MKYFPIDIRQLSFASTDFSTLMQKRIYRILIVCSNYDFYILEEDGRIEEQIFNEYNTLNFRFPPVVLHADSAEKALTLLNTVDIDLVIYMLNPHQSAADGWLRQIKQMFPHIPLVALIYFSHKTSAVIEKLEKGLIDHTFCWLGNADLLVAIIKLLEDKFNAPHDILQVGTQAILVVEDSIHYISTMLPMLYKIIVWQSQEMAKEGLNEHQKMLRLRGRPKILLAKTYNEAIALYNEYADNILGVITDVGIQSDESDEHDEASGLRLAQWLRNHDPYLPILLQSSDTCYRQHVVHLQAGFIDKHSKTLSGDYKKYIATNFGFGDFVFRNPFTGEEYARASDLYELQHTILDIPDDIFAFHARRNDFSKWLNARALFGLGKIFRNLKLTDFSNQVSDARKFVYEAIAQYRMSKSRGIIARYERREFDEYVTFSRIGYASIGGKGRGLAFADSILKKETALNRFEHVTIEIPRTVVIATDVFDEFMELNQLYPFALSNASNEEILEKFLQARLPEHLLADLQNYIQGVNRPVAVRSSSKLEDSQLLPFAGIYKTYMIPHSDKDKSTFLSRLCEAIKCVYASVFYAETKAYFQSTANNLAEEKMAVILQEVCGQKCCNYYFPLLSGVALSYNFYPIPPETVSDGVAYIACGLGKYVVEGGQCCRFSPRHPQHALMFSSTEILVKNSQKIIYALSLDPAAWHPDTDDTINLVKITPDDIIQHPARSWIVSKYDIRNQQITDNLTDNGKTLVTFNGLLKYQAIPLPEIISSLLSTFEEEMHAPVEIEFALEKDTENPHLTHFFILQVRPMYLQHPFPGENFPETDQKQILVRSNHALGNGIFENIRDVIYVKPEKYNPAENYPIAQEIGQWNAELQQSATKYILIGPGRWGSSDPWLGIPVRWQQISGAQAIVEVMSENHPVDFSQGTHLFYNLISSGIAFLMTDSTHPTENIDYQLLYAAPLIKEGKYTRWVRFDKPLTVWVDGRKNKGIVLY